MESTAYFEGKASVIAAELASARSSVHAVVEWLTDTDLFESLCDARTRGIEVHLLLADDAINEGRRTEHDRLLALGAQVYRLEVAQAPLMLNRFCVIDRSTVITGSYDWTLQKLENYGNVTVTRDDSDLALRLVEEFSRLVATHFRPADLDMGRLAKRLELVKQLVVLGDVEDLPIQVQRLRRLEIPAEVTPILAMLESGAYGEAIVRIGTYLQSMNRVTVRADPEEEALRLELRVLEVEVGSLAAEEAAMQKRLQEFGSRHTRELGPILLRILELRSRLREAEAVADPAKQPASEEARSDYESYGREYQGAAATSPPLAITAEERDELKALFRKGVHQCHPDKVSEALKPMAEATFNELREAYERNDLGRVREIVVRLSERRFTARSEQPSEKAQLRADVTRVRDELERLALSIEKMKASEAWRQVVSIEDEDAWFDQERRRLEMQLEMLEKSNVSER